MHTNMGENNEDIAKTRTIIVKCTQKNGDIYVLEREIRYNRLKKRNDVLRTKLLSKIPKGSATAVPTRPKRPKRSGLDVPESDLVASRRRVGMMDIIDHIGKESGIDSGIYSSTDLGTAQKILSLARYLLATDGHSLPAIASWQFSHPLPYEHGLSESMYHDLFCRVGMDESLQQNFFRSRAAMLDAEETVAFDSTTVSTYSAGQPEARYGFNKAGDGLKTVKLLTLYSLEKRMPIAFTKMPGNLPDVTTQRNAMKQLQALGLDTVGLVTDNGYWSESNISELLQSGLWFLTLAKTSLSWIRPEIDAHREELSFISTACPYDVQTHGTTVMLKREFKKTRKRGRTATGASAGDEETFSRRIYLHIFYNNMRAAADRAEFEKDIIELKMMLEDGSVTLDTLSDSGKDKVKKYLRVGQSKGKIDVSVDDAACREAYKYHGFFALVSDKERDCFNALREYRRRELIEGFYRSGKQHADGDLLRVWGPDALRGRMFVQFVALCYYEYLSKKISDILPTLGKANGDEAHDSEMNLKAEKKLKSWMENTPLYLQLQWFDTVENVRVSTKLTSKRWSTEITMRDKMYLDRLGVRITE